MKQSIYIECYEGLSAHMLTDALLHLMPEEKAERKRVAGLKNLSCSMEARQDILHHMQKWLPEFALSSHAEQLFGHAYSIWLNAKAAVKQTEPDNLVFSESDFNGVIAMMRAVVCMDVLGIEEIICPALYEGFGHTVTADGEKQVPLPETLYILMDAGIGLQRMERDGAWVTPEAAALLGACKTAVRLEGQYQMIGQSVGSGTSSKGEMARLRVVLVRRKQTAVRVRPEVLMPKKEELELLQPDGMKPKFVALEPAAVKKDGDTTAFAENISLQGSDRTETCRTEDTQSLWKKDAMEHAVQEKTEQNEEYPEKAAEWMSSDEICKLECNLDDCSGEVLGYTMERLMREGARDVSYLPIYMKKNRPAYLLTVLCRPEDRERMERIIFAETTAIGIRHAVMKRSILHRKTGETDSSFGRVAVKRLLKEDGEALTLEYESVAAIARSTGLPFREVYRSIELELSGKNTEGNGSI